MKITNQKHIEFYSTEINTVKEKWEMYLSKQMKILISEKKLFIGRVWAIEPRSKLFILRFKSKEIPRVNTPYFMGLVGVGAVGDPSNWSFSYKDFRESSKAEYWGNRKGGEINIVNFWKTDNDWSFILVSINDIKLSNYLKESFLDNGLQPLVVIADSDPPLKYLFNLMQFVKENDECEILNLGIENKIDSWNPIPIDNEKEVLSEILNYINKQPITLIQGPPGTGKSYMAAKIIAYYLTQNSAVAVCALANKALLEIIGQPGLKNALDKGLLYKTNVSSDELSKHPQLRSVDELMPKQGQLLLTTYYKLSEYINELNDSLNRFDLLIIEESSQAFLATISMFSKIAKKVLIVGDQMQLSPVVITSEKKLLKIDPNIHGVINGMETFAYNNQSISYRFIKTRRLTKDAANLTGLFYNSQLMSFSPLNDVITHLHSFKKLFHPNGGISISKIPKASSIYSDSDILKLICRVASQILREDNKAVVAVLAPRIDQEKDLTRIFSSMYNDYKRITISTVHKVQGITCDYALVYLPLIDSDKELNRNFFNVATSRAKKGTLIMTYDHISLNVGIAKEVKTFMDQCHDVSEIFINEIKK